ncbi:MAG TPA: ABC transporter permease [Gemmatimonadaceae bacterium]|nr:ABC transporter permease [Gemmatimonadaceae bacterium]
MRFLLRRLAEAAALFWVVLTLTYFLLRAAPGDPEALLVDPSASQADIAAARERLGLDAPVLVQYARWTGGVLKADLGESFTHQRAVSAVLSDALPFSIGLGLASLVLTFAIGVTIGAVQAARRGDRMDVALTIMTTAAYAAPAYWLALALIAVFTYGASTWGLPPALRLPAFGVRDPAGEATGMAAAADVARHALLPTITLTAIGAAGIARYARTIIADLLALPFVRTARAKGVAPHVIHARHVVANARAPLVVLFALALPGVLAGSVFVETVFSWPGMGRLMVTAIVARDYPLVMGATLLFAGVVILSNLAADLILPLLDPRRRE